MAEPDLNKYLERFGAADFLIMLCPGAVAIFSLGVWAPLWGADRVIQLLKSIDSLPFSFLLLLMAYALGLILNAWASQGFVYFVEMFDRQKMEGSDWRFKTSISFVFLFVLHGRKYRTSSRLDVEARMSIYEFIRARYGESVVDRVTPANFMYIFRTLAWGLCHDHDEVLLTESDALFRRRGFIEGVSLASMLMCLQALVELGLTLFRCAQHLSSTIWFLSVAAVASGTASFILRGVTSKLYSDERIFTFALLRSAIDVSQNATSKQRDTPSL